MKLHGSLTVEVVRTICLCAEVAEERERWRSIRSSFNVRRPHDDPAYLELMAPEGASHRMLYFVSEGVRVMYAFHLQPVDPAIVGQEFVGWNTVTSPYGYGGPLMERVDDSAGSPPDVCEEWDRAWARWARENRVVSEFVREDLHRERLLPRTDGLHSIAQSNVVVPLDVDPDVRWRSYAAKVRKNVRRAGESGLHVAFSASADALAMFHEIYLETMQRRQAASSFEIGIDRLLAYVEETRAAKEAVVALTMQGSVTTSVELVLVGSHEIYSFLGGTRPEAYPMRPNDLLKHEVCNWGHAQGLREYVLGGGYSPGDGIFQYKTSFAPEGLRDFYTRRVILNESVYDEMVASRRAVAIRQGGSWHPRDDYFPVFLS